MSSNLDSGRDNPPQNQPSFLFQNQYADDALHQEGNVSGGVGYFTLGSSPRPESWNAGEIIYNFYFYTKIEEASV